MPSYLTPGVYIEEVSTGAKPIESASTTTAAFLGVAPKADAFLNEPRACNNWSEFVRDFCTDDCKGTHLAYAVYGYFNNGGRRCYVVNVGPGGTIAGDARKCTGVHAFAGYDEPSTICAPGCTSPADQGALIDFCENNGYMIAVLDGPERVTDVKELTEVATVEPPAAGDGDGGTAAARRTPKSTAKLSRESKFSAYYFPWLVMKDPFGAGNVCVPPSGHMAGIYAFNDVQRGVHKAPANYAVRTAIGLSQRITREQQGVLNQAGVNCIRYFADSGIRVWGARTRAQDPEWRYLNVRRCFNNIEKSIERGTQWVVFEPNDSVTRNSVIRDCTAYLRLQWLAGALVGTREQAFFVKCDSENNPQEVIDAGRLVVDIGIAPSKPAEFVCFRIGQWSGGAEVKTA